MFLAREKAGKEGRHTLLLNCSISRMKENNIKKIKHGNKKNSGTHLLGRDFFMALRRSLRASLA
jgi:hypothetical protein